MDFGTEFGLLVGARDCAEMHVFDGEVAVESDKATATGANMFRQGDVALVNSLGPCRARSGGGSPPRYLHVQSPCRIQRAYLVSDCVWLIW